MNETWSWLVSLAAWVFLAGTILVTASAVPGFARRWPKAVGIGFLLGTLSFVLVLAAWALPRLF